MHETLDGSINQYILFFLFLFFISLNSIAHNHHISILNLFTGIHLCSFPFFSFDPSLCFLNFQNQVQIKTFL